MVIDKNFSLQLSKRMRAAIMGIANIRSYSNTLQSEMTKDRSSLYNPIPPQPTPELKRKCFSIVSLIVYFYLRFFKQFW